MARYLRRTTQSFGHSVLRPPRVVNEPEQIEYIFFGPGRKLAKQPRRPAHSRLSAPVVVTATVAFTAPPIEVTLAPSIRRARLPHSVLRPPAVVGAGIAFHGPGVIRVARKIRIDQVRRFGSARLRPPVVVAQAEVFIASPIRVSLAAETPQQSALQRHYVASRLSPPVVVDIEVFDPCDFITDDFNRANEAELGGIWITAPFVGGLALVSNTATKSTASQNRSLLRQGVRSNENWVISARISAISATDHFTFQVWAAGLTGNAGANFRANQFSLNLGDFPDGGIITHQRTFAAGERVALRRILAGGFETYEVWHEPTNGAWQKILTATVAELAAWQNGALRPGVQMDGAAGGPAIDEFSFCPYSNEGIKVAVAVAHRLNRERNSSHLAPPAVVTAAVVEVFYGPQVTLTQPLRPPRAPRSVLRPPTVAFQAAELSGPEITLAPSHRRSRQAHFRLAPPAVVGNGIFFRGILGRLTYSRRGRPLSQLAPPVVVTEVEVVLYFGPQVNLTYSRRGKTISHLSPPSHVGAGIAFHGPRVMLTYSRRGKPVYDLKPPAVVAVQQPFFGPSATLAYSRRGAPKSVLHAPVVVGGGIAFYGPQTTLAYSRRGKPVYGLGPPVVVGVQALFFGPNVTLAYSRRGAPKNVLQPPAVIGAGIAFYGPQVWLAYSRRGAPHSRLAPPAVVGQPPFRPVQTHLAPSFRGQTKSLLVGLPIGADITFMGPSTSLAPQRRGEPLSRLEPPVVVAPQPLARPILVALAPQSRGVPESSLHPPAIVGAGIAFYGPAVHITRGRAGKPLSVLIPPPVIGRDVFTGPSTILTYSRRGRPLSELRAPARVGAGIVFRPVKVNLVTDRKRITVERVLQRAPHYRLRPPVVVRLAVEIYGPRIELAPSRFPKPKSKLRPPTVVGQPGHRPAIVWLAYSRRGRPRSFKLPFRQGIFPHRPILVSLAPSFRGTPKPSLHPPAVVGIPPHRPIPVHLTRNKPEPTVARIIPPAVVGAGIVFAPVFLWLTYSSRGKPISRIFPPTVTSIDFPGGDVCGFDIAASFACGSDTSANRATISGSDRGRGRATGGDRKAT